MLDRVKIFFSYAPADEHLRKELEKYLSPLKWRGLTTEWYDREIPPGTERAGEIDTHLNTSNIILLLVSSDFIASPYCQDVEVKRAIERHEDGEACVIPIILRPIDWEWAPFGKLQALPTNQQPIQSSFWKNSDEAFFDVAEGIRKAVEKLITQSLIGPTVPKQPGNTATKGSDNNHREELRRALLTLDYYEQSKFFKRFLEEKHQVGAFLIHGEPDHGQSWLLHRLTSRVPGSSTGKVHTISFQRKGRGRNLEALWRELAHWVGLKAFQSPQKIAEQVHKVWQTQTVIIILRNLYEIDEESIQRLIREFWHPLVEQTQRVPCLSSNHCLLFLIDNDGCTDEWRATFVRQPSANWNPSFPVKLERLAPFTNDILAGWMRQQVDLLPTTTTIQDILENSENGIPELALEHICNLCGCDWHESEKLWTKY